jgi:hypothetical protein
MTPFLGLHLVLVHLPASRVAVAGVQRDSRLSVGDDHLGRLVPAAMTTQQPGRKPGDPPHGRDRASQRAARFDQVPPSAMFTPPA